MKMLKIPHVFEVAGARAPDDSDSVRPNVVLGHLTDNAPAKYRICHFIDLARKQLF